MYLDESIASFLVTSSIVSYKFLFDEDSTAEGKDEIIS